MLEREHCIPRHRTWSFHQTDVGENLSLISDLITCTWPGYEVRLRGLNRSFLSPYFCIRPETLQHALQKTLKETLVFSAPVADLDHTSVRLGDGSMMFADCVLDARNLPRQGAQVAYQKFLGLHLKLTHPHGLRLPILMDACTPQIDGYRFFYTLPLGPNELLVEDTRYSSNPVLDVDLFTTEIESYATRAGWIIENRQEREQGVLPIPLDNNYFAEANLAKLGVGGGFFHPVTGYSLPWAVEVADRLSNLKYIDRLSILNELRHIRKERESRIRFSCRLNRMMFMAARPEERFRIFQHFYSLPEHTIQRFYADKINLSDRFRILMGKPPVKVSAALQALSGQGVPQ